MLWVRVVGGFRAGRGGVELPAARVGSRKARLLLAVLAVHRSAPPVDRLAAALWPDRVPRSPVSNIATLVSRLRSSMGAGIIEGDRTGYRLGGAVQVDLWSAAELVSAAESGVVGGQLGSALNAVRLLDGIVLPEYPDALWAESARSRHAVLLRRARHLTAELALTSGDPFTAEAAAQDAVLADSFDEPALRLLMRARHAAGDPAGALLAYQRLRVALATELGVDPDPSTRTLHTKILQHTAMG